MGGSALIADEEGDIMRCRWGGWWGVGCGDEGVQ